MTNSVADLFGGVIASYTRAEAIEDGVLVDCTQDVLGKLAREAGFKWPVAMTEAAFLRYVWDVDANEETLAEYKAAGQSVEGRWWDVLSMLKFQIRTAAAFKNGPQVEIRFKFACWFPKGERGYRDNEQRSRDLGAAHHEVTLKAVTGPGDQGEPVMTIMLPNED